MATHLVAQALLFSMPSRRRRELREKATREVDAGRKLAIYDRETGLQAYWYFTKRMEEELDRSARYGRKLVVALVEADRAAGERALAEIHAWLREGIRGSDLATHLGDGRFLILLPEADSTAAAAFRTRMKESLPAQIAGIGCFPENGASVRALRAAAEEDLGVQCIVERLQRQS